MAQRPNPIPMHLPALETGACGIGFVAHLRGEKSRGIVVDALRILGRLSHRGAVGVDPNSGDGAGILLQLPHRFFKREGLALGFNIPRRRGYGIGQVFLPAEPTLRAACERIVEDTVAAEGQRVIGWRDTPIVADVIGPVATRSLPVMRQIYVERRRVAPSAFERRLYVIRKRIENRIRFDNVGGGVFHIASLSSETIVYKGLMLPDRLQAFYPDLVDDDMVSGIALVHSRFATNTRPTWDLAQPLRVIAHNGEINTVQGNRAWINARRRLLQSGKFQGGVERLWPILEPDKSDSMSFDNMLELLTLGGRSLPHAMMMMIPEAWEHDLGMPDDRRAFYEYAGSLLEPWDGPAAVAFTDGLTIGATVDRNGLRPARYLVTNDDRVILASEAGVLDVDPDIVIRRGRLQPGRMFLVDTTEGRILEDNDVKRDVASRFPYRRWLQKNSFQFDDLPARPAPARPDDATLMTLQRAFGWVDDDVNAVLLPMAQTGKEATGSMGNDSPLATLSEKGPPLFDYFHQRFAQVTNPPIDPLRERLVMTLHSAIGPDGNTLEETPEQCHHIRLPGPVLTSAQLERLKAVQDSGVFASRTLSMLYPVDDDGRGNISEALERLCQAAIDAVDDGDNVIILSDRGAHIHAAAMPSLLALSAVQQRLVKEGIRTHVGLLIEAADVRGVHHVACLLGYGAAAVNPWLAVDTIKGLCAKGAIEGSEEAAVGRFVDAVDDGILKIMSKMGISTLQSYRGAQMFEAIGIDLDVVEKWFTGTPARIGGLNLKALHEEVRKRHQLAFGGATSPSLPRGGLFRFVKDGERHRWDPYVVKALQKAARTGDDPELWEAFRRLADGDPGSALPTAAAVGARPGASDSEIRAAGPQPSTLRDLLTIRAGGVAPIPLDDVEPAAEIGKRFVSGAMSLGAISPEAHETLAMAMNRLGARSNSGEGGEEGHRQHIDDDGSDRRSAIRQVASGRFGVTLEYLTGAKEIQIKMAQGAKPGEGGQLPGHKVNARIAAVRHSTPGVTLISPPPHHDIYSIEDFKQLIWDLQSVQPSATVSVKLVAQVGIGTVAAGVVKAGAQGITISGFEGGTGASPLSSLKHAGAPWEMGLAEVRQVLGALGLRDRVRLQVDGGLRTGLDVVKAALLGADEMGLATAALVAGGCVMMRKCHLNTCSVGVATQDEKLRAKFTGKADHVVSYFMWVAEDTRRLMASLGVARFKDLVGRVDLLQVREDLRGKAAAVDVSPILAPSLANGGTEHTRPVDVSGHWDLAYRDVVTSLVAGRDVDVDGRVENVHRAVGTWLSGELVRQGGARNGAVGTLRLEGSAGQSFGAFLGTGLTLRLTGEANDGVAKGLSGGTVVVKRPSGSGRDDDVIIGNVALYGATAGTLLVAGRAGERFAVRNSGAVAVVEGVGDHGCEYMTGGVVVVMGPIGRNFGAGMSGGVAYVLDPTGDHSGNAAGTPSGTDGKLGVSRLHPSLQARPLDDADEAEVRRLIASHVTATGSRVGHALEREWDQARTRFVKIVADEYLAALAALEANPSASETGEAEAEAEAPPAE